MQRFVQILDESARVLASVPFTGTSVPGLDQIAEQLPPQSRENVRFRFDNGVVNESQWQKRAQAHGDRILYLRLRAPPPPPAPGSDQLPSGSLFAVSGPSGDTVYDSKTAFDDRVHAMLREGGWDELKLVFPPEHADEYLGVLGNHSIAVLQTQGAVKVRQQHHEREAMFGGACLGASWAIWRRASFKAAAKEVGQKSMTWGRGAVFLAEAVGVGLLIYSAMAYVLPRACMDRYTVIMQRSRGTHRLEVLKTIATGDVLRELILGREVEEMLDELIGQSEFKEQIHTFAKLKYNTTQKDQWNPSQRQNNMVLQGSPGTGKTTAARILGKVLKHLGITKLDTVVEVQREDLVGEYIGLTARKTRDAINRAKGGVLFVDEAYRLKLNCDRDFGKEAIEEIMRDMEAGDPIVVFAGYASHMQAFMRANPGLERRVQHTFTMQDYSCAELAQIFTCKTRHGRWQLEQDVTEQDVANLFQRVDPRWLRRHNGGAAVRLLSRGVEQQARRLFASEQRGEGGSPASRQTLALSDLEEAMGAILGSAAQEV